MKTRCRILSFFFILGAGMADGVFAQAPDIPRQPPSDFAEKKAEAAQKAAEKAEGAKKSAAKAEAAQKAAAQAKAAQELSANAQKAAEKTEAASAAADKAASAQKSADKAETARKSAAKAEAAGNAATKAEATSAAAEKAAAAQKADDKAAAAQKSAVRAEVAQKSAAKAEAAQKASEKAAAPGRPAEKSQAAQVVAEKAASRQATVDKLTTINRSAAQAQAPPDVTRLRALNQPAPETKGGDDRKTPGLTVKGEPRNPITDRKAREEAARSADIPVPALTAAAPTAADEIRLAKETVRDGLADLEVAPEVAKKLADEFVDPEKAPAARVRVEELANASSGLQAGAVPEETRRKIIDEVSRSADPAATANEKVGEAATEEVFGKDVAVLVPADKRAKFREVFQNLAALRSGLETIGASPDDPEVVEAVKEGAVKGVTTREETRVLFEGAGQKVLDRQGFSPAKEGEDFGARLERIADEQKAELAAMKAAKAAASAAAAAKLTRGKVSLGEGITQGAAGSTAVGRSVSARVEVAVGGGKAATSGAGRATQGTGTDASKATGTGGQNRSELLASRLPADTGGASTAGQVTTGRAGQAAPGAVSAPAVSSKPAAQGALEAGVGADAAQAATTAAPTSPAVNAAGPASPAATSSTVSSPADEFLVGGGEGSSFGGHFQSDDGNTGGNLTFNPDGTFSGTVTTVTRDASGNITNSSESSVAGTWGVDANGNVVVTSATTAPSTSSDNNQSAPPAGNQSSNNGGSSGTGSNSNSSTGTGSSDDDDDDDDDSDDDTPPPPPAAETKTEETPVEQSAEETKAADSTPNPMDDGGVSPTALAEQTGGRLGGSEARRQQRSLQLRGSGGGAGGPNPDGNSTTQTLLTPEEEANAARLIGMKTGGGVTNPNPNKTGGMAVTARDLKELHLRGNGGASGPTDTTAPAPSQDPNSPVPGLAPGPRRRAALASTSRHRRRRWTASM